MDVFLIRHGQTAGNLKKRYIGRTDEPLCPQGASDCLCAGTFPEITRVYVSPMLRAKQTAGLMFPNAEQIIVDGLREMDFGVFEGKCADEMEKDSTYRAWVDGMCKEPCPGGEGVLGFSERVCEAFRTIAECAAAECCKQLIIVAHGGTVMSVMSRFAVPERDFYGWQCGNCRCWRAQLRFKPDGSGPQLYDCAYLEEISF